MSTQHVRYSVEQHIATITLARPPLNAFSIAFLDEIIAALRSASTDGDVRAVVLASDIPKMFCAGLDLDIILGSDEATVRGFLNRLYIELWDVQRNLGKPSIAAVDGAARGGGMTLAISCDMIIAREALSLGLVSRVVGAGQASDEAQAAARTIAGKSPAAIAFSRAAFHRETDRDYTEAVARAVDDFCALAVSPDAQEGLRAFLDKRKPEWPAK